MSPPTREKENSTLLFLDKRFSSLFVEVGEQGRLICPLEFRAVKSQERP